MTASSRGSRDVVNSFVSRISAHCVSSLPQPRRQYATAAASLAPPVQPLIDSHMPPVTSSGIRPYVVKSGIILSRPPLITKALTPFEKAFYFYEKRLNERLAMPFTRYFYFKKDTPADNDWKRKAKERNGTIAKELGGYQAYGKLGWNDEVLVGDKISDPRVMLETLVQDAVMRVEGEDGETDVPETKVERPSERWTVADKAKDTKRLDRKLARTLYLCVKGETDEWRLPSGTLAGRENLHQAAERILVQAAGVNMNTWIVGHVPVGYYIENPELSQDSSIQESGEKTFFMKGRIMAGQANLKENLFGLKDFKWLTKEEVHKHVGKNYFAAVKNMMSDR